MQDVFQVLVPVADNWGALFGREKHDLFYDFVRERTGGVTILPEVKGQWRDPRTGKLFLESMIPVNIATSAEVFEDIARHAAAFYEQNCIFTCKVGTHVQFVDA